MPKKALQRTAASCLGFNRAFFVAAVAELGSFGDLFLINDYAKQKHAVYKM